MSTVSEKIAALTAAAETMPEYRGIVPLFIELYRYLGAAGDATGISFAILPGQKSDQLAEGFPWLSPTDVVVDNEVCSRFICGVIDVLKKTGHDGAAELDRVAMSLQNGTIDIAALFRGILERNRSAIDDSAHATGVPAPLLEYIFEIPLKHSLEHFASTLSVAEHGEWHEGYCPVCGSRAGMAEIAGEEGKRYLACSACNHKWQFKRLQCPYCGNQDAEKMSYFTAGEGATRVDTCKACSRYIKTRDSRKANGDVPLDIEDLLTMHLDLLASREGFERGK